MGGILLLLTAATLCLAYECIALAAGLSAGNGRTRILETLSRDAVRRFRRSSEALIGLRLEFTGRSALPPGRFMAIANHQSLLDIPVLMDFFGPGAGVRFVAKRELGRGIPFISRLLRDQGHCLVGRDGRSGTSMRELGRFAERCAREGTRPVLFPEGTRSRDGRLGRFHSAGFRRIQSAGLVPVVVLAIDGGCGLSTLRRVVAARGELTMRVELLAVLQPPDDRQGQRRLLELARTLVARKLESWRAQKKPSRGAGRSSGAPGRVSIS